MNAHLAHSLFSGITSALGAAPVHNPYVADQWRRAVRDIREHIMFCQQHMKTIAERDERLSTGTLVHRPKYVAHCEKRLADRLCDYTDALRERFECEAEMQRLGMQVAS